MILVKKKNGTSEPWDFTKIVKAVGKSAERIDYSMTDEDISKLQVTILNYVGNTNPVDVTSLHHIVEISLQEVNKDVAESYINYRYWRKSQVKELEELYENSQDILFLGDRENANYNSALVSTKGVLIRGHMTTSMFKRHYMSKAELQAMKDGYLYFHDRRDLVFAAINCCLFDMGKVLRGGFEMSSVQYKEPKTINVALQILTDITLVATAQQFGGFTIPQLDKILVYYFRKSLAHWKEFAKSNGFDNEDDYAMTMTMWELRQGMQALEMRLNTVPSSRGDTAFVTVTFGNCDVPEDAEYQRLIGEVILKTRMDGQGAGTPVVFPKLVYLYSKEQHNDPGQQRLFSIAKECNGKAMYPDYLSLDAGEVGRVYKQTGKVIDPMGCRAFLSEDDSGVFEGRANIGAVSLNLPMIWKKSEGKTFWVDLTKYLELTRVFLKKRYAAIADNVCSTNPLAFTQGGLLGGNKLPTDKIGMDIVRHFTASFGITALNELNVLMEGKELHNSDRKLVNLVVDFINNKIDEYKTTDGLPYALYGTPAESLAGTQLRQFKDAWGVIPGVSDKDYFSNSFHCPVTAEITPIQKQDMETELFHKIAGGHIVYCRIANKNNVEALDILIRRAMEKGLYFGVNFDLVVCEDCKYRPEKYKEVCPECGSNNVTIISRICGYLGVRYRSGNTRVNDSKLAEMNERISM